MSHSGARQWRHPCECAPEVAEQRDVKPWVRMHSQVSKSNASFFISEDRIDADLAHHDVSATEVLEQKVAETDGYLIVCNVCGRLKEVET